MKTEEIISMLKENGSVQINGKDQYKTLCARNRVCIQLRKEKIKHNTRMVEDEKNRFEGYRIVLL